MGSRKGDVVIVEVQANSGLMSALPLGVAALCALGFFILIRRNVILALAIALFGAGALVAPMILSARISANDRPFEVIVVNDQISESGFEHKSGFKGGEYMGPDGRRVPLQRQKDWPRAATLIVNDSDRLVTVRRYHYAASSNVAAGTPLIEVVFPREQAVMEGYVYAMEDEGAPPPESLRSRTTVDMIDILYRSREPYDPARHGNRERLIGERDIMK